MHTPPITFPGTFPDVTYDPNADVLLVSRCAANEVLVDAISPSGEQATIYRAFCDGSGFARVYFDHASGHAYLAYRPNSGLEVVLVDLNDGREVTRIQGVFFNNPVALGPGRFAVVNFLATQPGTYIYTYAGQHIETLPITSGSMGLAFYNDGRAPKLPQGFVSMDAARGIEADSAVLNAQYALDGTFTGEDFTSTIGGARVVKQGIGKTFLDQQFTYVPKIVQHGVLVHAVVTSDYQTVTLLKDITSADLGVPSEPPVDPPTPPTGPVQPPDIVITLQPGQKLVVHGGRV